MSWEYLTPVALAAAAVIVIFVVARRGAGT
jgi:hypothetical protein